MIRSVYRFALLSLFMFAGVAVFGQETEERVVDEVIAQVNDGVITLSRIKREMKAMVDLQVEQGKSREEAERLVNEKQGEMIANLINEELLIQRAKELNLDREVESNLNQRFLQIMQQYEMKTLDALYAEMRRTGVDPDELREVWRKQATREMVIQQEVQRKLYWQATSAEMKAYFDKNKEKFTKPETFVLSEIFLGYAGNTEPAVREKAKTLLAELRAGGDFQKAVMDYSDRSNKAEQKGSLGKITMADLEKEFPKIAAAVKGLKTGAYSEPVAADETGLIIFRVDEYTPASNDSQFDENAVRMAILNEKAPAEGKKFMATLRRDSYIKISDAYRPVVAPILFEEERKEKASN
jgi:hypothetical protein